MTKFNISKSSGKSFVRGVNLGVGSELEAKLVSNSTKKQIYLGMLGKDIDHKTTEGWPSAVQNLLSHVSPN